MQLNLQEFQSTLCTPILGILPGKRVMRDFKWKGEVYNEIMF